MENQFEIKDGVLIHCTVNQPDVIIPDGVNEIGYHAYREGDSIYGQDKIVSVTIPEGVTKIGDSAFRNCKNLEKVTILGPAEIGRDAFCGCKKLTEVFLADGVRSIGYHCFAFCERLNYLYIPESVVRIESDIAYQNDNDCSHLVFLCYGKGKGEEWSDDWNLMYNDPRFGSDRNHYYYHSTHYGVGRDGKTRKQTVRLPVTDMPHGTGKTPKKNKYAEHSKRLPLIKLRLWLTATMKMQLSGPEYQLDEEERKMLPNMLREPEAKIIRELDSPWEITIDDESGHLAPELIISAWVNNYDDQFDGRHLIVHHDMPFHIDPYEKYPVSLLKKGETVIAEREINNGSALFDVRLHIHWIKNENSKQSLEKVLKMISQEVTTWTYNDDDNEIEVLLAHKQRKATKYKIYKPSEFPHQFFADLKTDAERWSDLDQIVIQPYRLYQKLHSFSDDYKDAAEAYGEDCSDWYSTERSISGQRLIYEVG